KIAGADLGKARLPEKKGREPTLRIPRERLIGQIGPGIFLSRARLLLARPHPAPSPALELLRPRQLVDAERRHAFCERERRRFVRRDGRRRILEKQRAEPALAPAAERARRGVERQIVAKLDM